MILIGEDSGVMWAKMYYVNFFSYLNKIMVYNDLFIFFLIRRNSTINKERIYQLVLTVNVSIKLIEPKIALKYWLCNKSHSWHANMNEAYLIL